MSESIDPQLNDIAVALAALAPHTPALDRDRILFNAGRASAPRPWFWRLSAATSASLAVALAVILLVLPAPTPIERVVYVQVTPPPIAPPKEVIPTAPPESEPQEPPDSWPTTPYTRLENRLLRWGLDGLDEPSPPPAAPPATLKSLLESL